MKTRKRDNPHMREQRGEKTGHPRLESRNFRGALQFVKSDSRGFSLIEVMVALAILLMAAVGALSLFDYSLRATSLSKYRTAATNIARAKLEEVKSVPFEEITTTYPDGSSYTVESPSLPDGATWQVNYVQEPDLLDISLSVLWQDEGGKTSQIELKTLLTSQ